MTKNGTNQTKMRTSLGTVPLKMGDSPFQIIKSSPIKSGGQAPLNPEDSGADVFTNNGNEYTRRGVLNQNDYVMTDYDSTQTEFYKVNTATELTYSGNISYINTSSATAASYSTATGYRVSQDMQLANVNISGTAKINGSDIATIEDIDDISPSSYVKSTHASGNTLTITNVEDGAESEVSFTGGHTDSEIRALASAEIAGEGCVKTNAQGHVMLYYPNAKWVVLNEVGFSTSEGLSTGGDISASGGVFTY